MNTFTDWIIAYMAVITAGLTFGLLVTACWAASAARDTLAQMRADSEGQRQDSARATRPYVYPMIVPGLGGERTWDLVVENHGRTAAYDLQVKIEADHVQNDTVTQAVQRFADAGTMLPPRARIRTYWAIGEDARADPPEPIGFPRATVTLSYSDSEHKRFDEERAVVLDPDLLGLAPVPFAGATHRRINDRADRLNMENAVRAIARHVGELNR